MTTAAPRTARVLDAALGVLTERTYGGATAPQVAERAAIGLATIYRSFPGEGALANVVFRRAKRDLLDRLLSAVAALAADAGAHARVPAVSQGQAAFAAADPAGFAYLEHQQHASYLDAQSQALCARVESVAVEVVRAGQASVVSAFLDSAVDSVEIADGPFAGFNRDLVDRYRKAQDASAANMGITPEKVAGVIVSAATASRPRSHYAVRAMATTLITSRRLPPDLAWDGVIRSVRPTPRPAP